MPDIRHVQGYAQDPGGPRLYWQGFAVPEPKAVLLFVHGLAEHSGRYLNPALYLAPRGYACYALDCRGHGRSAGRRVHVTRFDEFVQDVRTVGSLVRARHPGLAFFLVGHSQGGLIVLRYVLRQPEGLAGVVASAPALGVHPAMKPSATTVFLAQTLSRLAPKALLDNHVDPRALCHDEAVVEAYRRDPLVSRKVSARWYTSIVDAMAEVWSDAPGLSVPALVMASGADRLVSTDATRRWVERAPRDRVEHVVWDGLYHEMFNEPERDLVFKRMEGWLDRHLHPRQTTT